MSIKSLLICLGVISTLFIASCSKTEMVMDTIPDMDPDTTSVEQIINSYTMTPNLLGALPISVDESSGVAVYTSASYWTHNDRGDKAILYLVDETGTKLREFEITNSDNEDWEDLATDSDGNLYVADTGNNDNDRQDLRIYIIPSVDLINTTGVASVINVIYEDQIAFPPSSTNLNYDVEATVFLNGFIYMFTRDRTMPFVGKTKLYKIEAIPGTQTATLISEFNTENNENDGAITGAGMSPSGEVLSIVSNTRMWVFKNYQEDEFFEGDIDIYTIDTDTKIEAVGFIDECTVVFSDEKKGNRGGNLYNSNICN